MRSLEPYLTSRTVLTSRPIGAVSCVILYNAAAYDLNIVDSCETTGIYPLLQTHGGVNISRDDVSLRSQRQD